MNLLVVDALNSSDSSTKVHFVFDEQNILQAKALQTFRETAALKLAKGRSMEQVKSVAFVRSVDKEGMGIQLADMYAYAWNRYLGRGQSSEKKIFQIPLEEELILLFLYYNN